MSSNASPLPPTVSDPALAAFKAEIISFAGGPLKDPHDVAGQRPNMAHIHWMFITAFETVWEAADKCQGDEANFVAYAVVVVHELEQHHHAEETIFFPYLIQKSVEGLDHNIEEHAGMHALLETLAAHLRDLTSDPSTLDATKLRALMSPLMDELVPHLRHELDTLAPERLDGHLGLEEMREMNKMVEDMLKAYDPTVFIPLFIVNVKPGLNFPPLPFFVRRILLPTVFKRKHAALWKYGRYPREVDLW